VIRENRITLPPLQAPLQRSASPGGSSYALPPISAMEDLRGIHANDSAAVLRRLMEDDNERPSSTSHEYDSSSKRRRRSFSFQPYRSTFQDSVSRMQDIPRSYPDKGYRARTPYGSDESEENNRRRHNPRGGLSSSLSVSVSSDVSYDGMSTCDPSPISPATPRSATSTSNGHVGLLSPHHQPATIKSRRVSESFHPLSVPTGEWTGYRRHDEIRNNESAFPRRHSDADSDTAHPHRPW